MIKKLLITHPYNICAFESWLSDLALKGLYLKKIGHFFCGFTKGAPSNMEYRVDIGKKAISEDQKDLYLLYGWHYVTSKKNAHIFCCSTEHIKQEIHTIPIEQSYTLIEIKKRKFILMLIFAAYIITLMSLCIYSLFYNDYFTMNLVNNGTDYLYYLLICLVIFLLIFKQYYNIEILYKKLLNGNNIHHVKWKKNKIYSKIIYIFTFFILIFLFINICISIMNISYNFKIFSSKKFSVGYTISTLKDIEETSNSSYNRTINKKTSLLAKSIYVINETMLDNTNQNISTLRINHYILRTDSLANDLLNDLMNNDLEIYSGYEFIIKKIKLVGFDNIYIVETDYNEIYVYLNKNSEVTCMKYSGTATSDDIISSIQNYN